MDEILKSQIIEIWKDHVNSNQFVIDGAGNAVNNIDDSRLEAIEVIKVIIKDFISDEINLVEFKSALDVFNRHNNLWNFSAKMGQMYFNLLLKANEDNYDKLAVLLKNVISEPKDLKEALKKIEDLEKFTNAIFLTAEDKRKVPYPGSVGYFLSYFWQVHNPQKWPIIYSALINGFREIGVWKDQTSQKSAYNYFYGLNEELKSVLNESSHKTISNWDIEHTFWNFKFVKNPYLVDASELPENSKSEADATKTFKAKSIEAEQPVEPKTSIVQNEILQQQTMDFDIFDYLIPKVSKLFAAKDDLEYQALVAEAFRQLEFETELLPQGPRKNPYAILKFREENTAFIMDVRMSSSDYFTTTDDRALKEAINDHCGLLRKEGYKKTGLIIVCNSFDENFDIFINYINWHSEINKTILMTSDALLHMLAYKNKDKIKLENIVNQMTNLNSPVTSETIVKAFQKP